LTATGCRKGRRLHRGVGWGGLSLALTGPRDLGLAGRLLGGQCWPQPSAYRGWESNSAFVTATPVAQRRKAAPVQWRGLSTDRGERG
jgi:hypothetical protein